MKIYPEELKAFDLFVQDKRPNTSLNKRQLDEMKSWANGFSIKVRKNKRWHNLLNLIVLSCCLALWTSLAFSIAPKVSGTSYILAAILTGLMSYSLVIFTLHEGASHNLIFLGNSRVAKILRFLSSNLNRLFFVDPVFYHSKHVNHHQYTGTEKDGAYTHFVWPSRFFLSLLPLAGALPFCDYKIHTSEQWTTSKVISELMGVGTIILVSIVHYNTHSVAEIILFNIIFLSVSFLLDRLRETVDHNLMPVEQYGARSLGSGFWGLLIGGGPWGQPCHLIHHLCPSLPWYGQIMGHHKLETLLDDEQKKVFMALEKRSFPFLLMEILSKNIYYARQVNRKELEQGMEHESL